MFLNADLGLCLMPSAAGEPPLATSCYRRGGERIYCLKSLSLLVFSHLDKLISKSLWLLICFSSLVFLSTPPSLPPYTLHIALPQEVQEVCEVGGSGGGDGGGREERPSPEIYERA